MEESLLTRYLNSRTHFNKGYDFEIGSSSSKNSIKNHPKNKSKLYGGNTTNIPRSQFVKMLELYHDDCCGELVNEIYDYLNDKYNNHCGYNMNPMEINIDQIRDLLLDLTKQKFNLSDSIPKNKTYNLIHNDTMNEEVFNDISIDLLEQDEYAKVDMDTTSNLDNDVDLNMLTVEEVFDKYVWYYGPNYESYTKYINKLLDKLGNDIDDELVDKLRARF